MRLRLVITIVVAVLLAVFILQNQQAVTLSFLGWNVRMPRALMFFALLVIGVGLGWLWRGGRGRKR